MKKYFRYINVFVIIMSLFFMCSCTKKYTVTYQTDGGNFSDGSTYKEQTYNKKETLVLPDVPSKEGYTFQGWANNATGEWIENGITITSNLDVTAKWQEKEVGYTITYQAKSGTFDDGSTEKQVKVKPDEYLPYDFYPIIQDRYFSGWYDEETNELVYPGTIPTKDMVVYAKYKRSSSTSTVLFHETLSSKTSPIEAQYNEQIIFAFPIPKREGFQFLGWYDNPSFTGNAMFYQNEETTGDKEYWASWKLIDVNYAQEIFDEIVPNEVDGDLNLLTEYCDTLIYWETSDYQLINNKGVVTKTHNFEKVTMKATITFNGQDVTCEKEVTIQPIEFKVLDRPVAGYFYGTGVTNMTETFLENFDIAYYAFALVRPNGDVMMENVTGLNKFLEDAKTLKKHGIRIVLSIAGGADNFSTACRSKGSSYVAQNIVDLVVKYGFDGVDIDWEFPSDASDMQRMNTLCKSIRIKLDALVKDGGTPYLLTAAIPSSESYSKFDLNTLNDYLDYVNMMSYDMNAAGLTTHLCPLLKANTDGNKGYGVDQGISYFTRAGLDKDKIIIGAAFYGKSYKVLGTTLNEKYPGLGVHAELLQIQYSSGTITYSYIARNILPNRNYVCYWDDKAKASYLYNETDQIFITFENEQSLIEKTIYAYENNVGIMFWEYGYDYNNVLTDTICNKMHELKNAN